MILVDLSIVGLQLALPIAALVWLAWRPAGDLLSWLVRTIAVGLYLLALCLVPVWLMPPWWTPWVFLGMAVVVVLAQVVRGRVPVRRTLPGSRAGQIGTFVLAIVAVLLATMCVRALSGRAVPDEVVDLAFPLGPGTYLVVTGGSTGIVNGHFLTLEPRTDRQRAYRGQSYAVDLVQLDALGRPAPGWRPRDPAAWEIFGEPVLAPCAGVVRAALDDRPDMPVPEMDTSLLEGNHVFLDCGAFGVLLAHFRQGSVRVAPGDAVRTGDVLGEAGNSGQTGAPHLHVHAQRIPADGPLLSGEPLFITLEGRFPVRNDRLVIEGGDRAP